MSQLEEILPLISAVTVQDCSSKLVSPLTLITRQMFKEGALAF